MPLIIASTATSSAHSANLQDEGYVEITTSAATHGYLPLLGHDSAIRGQIKTGVSRAISACSVRDPTRHLVARMCLPPRVHSYDDGSVRPGIEVVPG